MCYSATAHFDSQCDGEWRDCNVTLSNHWEVHKVVNLLRTRSPSPLHNGLTPDFFGFIFLVSKHQIITWPSVISPVSAQDELASLNQQHGSPSLYQTFHFPVPFYSRSHTISTSLLLSSFSLQALIWSGKKYSSVPGNFGQRTCSLKSLSITVIRTYPGKTRTVVRETLILLHCQLYSLKYSGMTTGAAETYLTVVSLDVCGIEKNDSEVLFNLFHKEITLKSTSIISILS